jgi:hypothetical protein
MTITDKTNAVSNSIMHIRSFMTLLRHWVTYLKLCQAMLSYAELG